MPILIAIITQLRERKHWSMVSGVVGCTTTTVGKALSIAIFDVTIDLGKETDIKQVRAEFIQLKGPYVWLPKQVIISSSVDGEHYDTLATVDNDISPDIETLQFKEFGWEGNAKARYIRYKALSNGIAGGWLFTDEIRIK